MTIEQLGSIGELVGAMLVMITLVFLSTQIRAQNATAKADGHRDLIKQLASLHRRLGDEGVADLLVRGWLDFGSLDHMERIRFDGFLHEYLHICEQAFYMGKDKYLPAGSYDAFMVAAASFISTPGARQWREDSKIGGMHRTSSLPSSASGTVSTATSHRPGRFFRPSGTHTITKGKSRRRCSGRFVSQRRTCELSEEVSMFRRVVTFTAAAMSIASTASQAQSPPDSEQAKRIEGLVERAAALIESRGQAAFVECRTRDSEWWFDDVYLFIYDQNLNVLNAAFPQRVGTNPRGEKDMHGKVFHDAFLDVVRTKGFGWVDYMFPKPGQTEPSRKWSYVKAVDIEGTPGIIRAGFYPN